MGHCPLQTGKQKANTYILILARQGRYKTLVAKCGIGNAVQRNWKKQNNKTGGTNYTEKGKMNHCTLLGNKNSGKVG
jgi:hypothetical protein